jgi:hypothetical protein
MTGLDDARGYLNLTLMTGELGRYHNNTYIELGRNMKEYLGIVSHVGMSLGI